MQQLSLCLTLLAFVLGVLGSTLAQFGRNTLVPVHGAVLRAVEEESRYPPHLTNPFYKTPRVRQALAKASWFRDGEQPVYNREAEKITRHQIYNVLTHAGFVSRQRRP